MQAFVAGFARIRGLGFRRQRMRKTETREPVGSPTVRQSDPAPRRNDACPCGSGKKYKKCCMRQKETGNLSIPMISPPKTSRFADRNVFLRFLCNNGRFPVCCW